MRAQNDSIAALSKQSPTDTYGRNETGLAGPVGECPGCELGGFNRWSQHRAVGRSVGVCRGPLLGCAS